jgi:muramidase (phage lysozyme)
MNTNRKAFLDMLAVSEGTSTSKATQCDGYDVIVVGLDGAHELITDFSTHPFADGLRPSKVFNRKGETSSASGRYQFMKKDWAHYRAQLNLTDTTLYPNGAFSAKAQDAWAIQLIRERGALQLIDHGDFDLAVSRCRNIWASLPGAGYGQHENSLAKLQAAYVKAGGLFAVATTEAVVEAVQAAPVKPQPAILTIIMAVLKFLANLRGKKT